MSMPPPIPPAIPGAPARPYGYQPYEEPPRVSGFAVTALICSLLLCVPFISGLLGLIFGVVALIITANPKRRGRIMAIIAILVSLLGIGLWGGASYFAYSKVGAPWVVAARFADAMKTGDLDEAKKYVTPEFDTAQLAELKAELASLGRFEQMMNVKGQQAFVFDENTISGQFKLVFERGVRVLTATMTHTDNGWKVSEIQLTTPSSSTLPSGTTPVEDFSERATTPSTTLPAVP